MEKGMQNIVTKKQNSVTIRAQDKSISIMCHGLAYVKVSREEFPPYLFHLKLLYTLSIVLIDIKLHFLDVPYSWCDGMLW